MSQQHDELANGLATILRELLAAGGVRPGQLVVFGVSTSEVAGQRIGTSGAEETAEALFAGLSAVRKESGFYPVFQCCEHLNRALVLEREAAEKYGLDEVGVVPVPKAGGSMAAYAYRHLHDPVVVEKAAAHAGIDIGDTLIGMHLRPVAVPFRPSLRKLGEAHVNAAFTRPKLIGGARAVYRLEEPGKSAGTCE